MSININNEALRIAYKKDTGNNRPENPYISTNLSMYIEWLEEKVTEMLLQEDGRD